MRFRTILAVSTLALMPLLAHADTIATFNATGTFTDDATLSGTVDIDTTIGLVTSVDLTVSAPDAAVYNFIQVQEQIFADIYLIQTGSAPLGLPNVNLGVIGTSLIGYSGGDLSSIETPVDEVSDIFFNADNVVILESGELTPAVPEPATFALMGTGLVGLAGAIRRRIYQA